VRWQYGLFLDPVDEQEFPGYLDTIGGRDNAMDLATMEEKIETGLYKSMDQFEVSYLSSGRRIPGSFTNIHPRRISKR
jgi:hypothetical protein